MAIRPISPINIYTFFIKKSFEVLDLHSSTYGYRCLLFIKNRFYLKTFKIPNTFLSLFIFWELHCSYTYWNVCHFMKLVCIMQQANSNIIPTLVGLMASVVNVHRKILQKSNMNQWSLCSNVITRKLHTKILPFPCHLRLVHISCFTIYNMLIIHSDIRILFQVSQNSPFDICIWSIW